MKKLYGPFKILRRINSNAYIVDLSPDFSLSPSVNIEDLVACKGPIFSPDKPLLNKPFPKPTFERPFLLHFPKENPTTQQNKLMKLLMIRFSTRNGGYQKFLVRWKRLPDSVNS